MAKLVFPILLVLALPSVAATQTAVSGSSRCPKPDTQHTIQVGDHPDHTFAISKVKCTWPTPLVVAGFKTASDDVTGYSEGTGNTSTDHAFVVGTMSNGDQVFVRSQGTSVLKAGAPLSYAGTWAYTGAGGTGKFKGISGKGTIKCTWSADGASTCAIEGLYRLPH